MRYPLTVGEKVVLVVCAMMMAWVPLQRVEQKVEQQVAVVSQLAEEVVRPSAQHIEKQVKVYKPFKLSKEQMNCLIDNVYYEAGNQSDVGMKAVAFVTLNRVQDPRYPKTPCGVVHQKAEVMLPPADNLEAPPEPRTICQFSWVCMEINHNDPTLRRRARQAAQYAVENYYHLVDPTKGSIYFHGTYVSPKWKYQKRKMVQIEDHIFYR